MSVALDLRSFGRPARFHVWVAAGVVLYLGAGALSLLALGGVQGLLLRPLGLGAEPGTAGWGIYLAVNPLVWGASVAGAAGALGRRLVPGLDPTARAAVAVLVAGLLLAAGTTFAMHEFVRERYGLFDAESAGLVVFAAPAIVATALCGWAIELAPAHRRAGIMPLLVMAGAGFAAVTLPGLPGLRDDLSASGVLVAGMLLLDAVFSGVLVVRQVLRSTPG